MGHTLRLHKYLCSSNFCSSLRVGQYIHLQWLSLWSLPGGRVLCLALSSLDFLRKALWLCHAWFPLLVYVWGFTCILKCLRNSKIDILLIIHWHMRSNRRAWTSLCTLPAEVKRGSYTFGFHLSHWRCLLNNLFSTRLCTFLCFIWSFCCSNCTQTKHGNAILCS